MNPGRPHPRIEPKQTLRPNALIFGPKESSRADWEAVGTKRIRNHESGRRADLVPQGQSKQQPGDPRCLGERATGMGEPARGAG